MKTSSLHRQCGLNLIEILVAALILSVGLLSLAGLQVASLKSVHSATQKQQASLMIHELLERMRSNRSAVLNGSYNTEGVNCTSTSSPPCTGATTCPTADLAAYDLFSIQCGSSVGDAVDAGIAEQLLDGALTVRCISGGTDCSNGVTVTLTWAERLASKDIVEQDGEGGAVSAETEKFRMSVDAVI